MSANIYFDGDPTTSGDLERDLVALALDVGRAAREDSVGVLVCVDELQEMGRTALEALTQPRMPPASGRCLSSSRPPDCRVCRRGRRSRWDRATPTERAYLVAMSTDGDDPSQTADIATRMGRTQSNLGPIRAGLIGKGLVYPPEYGKIAFTVPGMAGFVQRRSSEGERRAGKQEG